MLHTKSGHASRPHISVTPQAGSREDEDEADEEELGVTSKETLAKEGKDDNTPADRVSPRETGTGPKAKGGAMRWRVSDGKIAT